MEADKEKRKKYLNLIKKINKNNLVYVDESGIDMTISREKSWSKKGSPATLKKSGKHYERTNIIAALSEKKILAPLVFNGSCNTEFFNIWVEKCLIRELKPGQCVVMDNASLINPKKQKN